MTNDGTGSAKSLTRSARRSAVRHRVEDVIDQLLDLRPHGLRASPREIAGHHAAQAVMLRSIDSREDRRRGVVDAPPPPARGGRGRSPTRIGPRWSGVLLTPRPPRRAGLPPPP